MKKFFKALALILALTLLVGAIPVSAADDEYEFYVVDRNGKKIKQKTLYIGEEGSQGKTKEGVECPSGNMYDLTNHVYGFDAETMDLKLKASVPDIISTWNQSDRIYAKKIGTVTLTISVYSKGDENNKPKKLGSTKLKVVVKKNADKIVVIAADSEGNIITDPTATFACNETYTVTLTRRDLVTGELTDTDRRRLSCEDSSVEITSLNPPYDTQYAVKFTKAGSFKLKAETYQSTKYDATLLSEDIEVKAGYTAENVKQSGLGSVDVSFTTAVQGLTASNFDIYYLVNGDEVRNNDPKSVECKDNVATVTFYNTLDENQEYFVKYDNKVVGSFTSYSFNKNSAKAIIIPDKQVEINDFRPIEYKIIDENNIDITPLLSTKLKDGNLEFSLDPQDSSASVYTLDGKWGVYSTEVEKTYTIKGTFSWIDDKGDAQKAEGAGKITTIAVIPYTQGSVVGAFNKSDKALVKSSDKSLDGDVKSVTNWALGDGDLYLQIAVPYTKNGATKYESITTAGEVAGLYSKYVFESADDNYVMVGGEALSGAAIKIHANQVGSTAIMVYGIDKNDGSKKYVGRVPVSVVAARATKEFDVTPENSKFKINKAYDDDTITFVITQKDQYGDKLNGNNPSKVKIEVLYGSTTTPQFAKTGEQEYNDGKFTVKGSDFTNATGMINLKFSVDNDHYKILKINVGGQATAASYKLSLSGAKLDTGIKKDTNASSIAIKLVGVTQDQFAAPGTSISFVESKPVPSNAITGSSVQYVYTISKDGGQPLTADALGKAFDKATNTVSATKAASDGAIKFATGTYTVTAYELKYDASGLKVNQISQEKFAVTNTAFEKKFERKDTALKMGEDITNASIANKAYKIFFAGAEITEGLTFDFEVNGDGTSAFVKSVSFKVGNDNVGFETIKVDINQVVRK